MATLNEITKNYAARIRGAAALHESVGKTAAGTAETAGALKREVREILLELDGLEWGDGTPFTPEQVKSALDEVDVALGTAPGTMRYVKEGSLKGLLAYNQAIDRLMASLAVSAKK